MPNRRQFVRWLITVAGIAVLPLAKARWVLAEKLKRILPKGTDPKSLFHENPRDLDTSHLAVTPVNRFEVMGDTDIKVDFNTWRLMVDGRVERPLSLGLSEVEALPVLERNVLLICPGFFSYLGRWKGGSLADLLKKAGAPEAYDHLRIHGKGSLVDKVERFGRSEIETGRLFLAYGVNGKRLPVKHGFPLRLVAEDRWGSVWVKYVYRVEVK